MVHVSFWNCSSAAHDAISVKTYAVENISVQLGLVKHWRLCSAAQRLPAKRAYSFKVEKESSDEWNVHIFTSTHTFGYKQTHTCTRSRSERQAERWGAQDGRSPWKWTAGCHGDCVGHVITGTIVTTRKLKGAKQGKQQREGVLISKRAKEKFTLTLLPFFVCIFFQPQLWTLSIFDICCF